MNRKSPPGAKSQNLIEDKIENPIRPDRKLWAAYLAYNQFTLREMQNGFAFKTLKKIHG